MNEKLIKRYPITEALLDIQVVPASRGNQVDYSLLEEKIKDRYPVKRDRKHFYGENFIIDGRDSANSSLFESPSEEFLFLSSDEKDVVQVRPGNLVFSRLKPYKKWGPFIEEAKSLWGVYREVAGFERINRITLRYVNKIEIPLPVDDLKDYIKTSPFLPSSLPQELYDFFMRFVVPFPDEGGLCAVIIQTVDQNTLNDEILPYIFDIGVFTSSEFEVDDETIWDTIERQKRIINRVFNESITNRTEELFL